MNEQEFKYGDQFKSVRETGARQGTDPKVNVIPEAAQNVSWPHRSLHQVLNDIKRVLEAEPVNKELIKSLIVEAEIYSSRMEAVIEDIDDYERLKEKSKEFKKDKPSGTSDYEFTENKDSVL
jgi:hypothetical protein